MSTHDRSTRRIRLLTPADVDELPLCKGCSGGSDRLARAVEAQDHYGWCGVRLGHSSAAVGAALIGPPTTDVDSTRIGLVWVHPQWRGHGVGRQLLQAVAAQTRRSGLDAVIGTGSRLVPTCQAPPVEWWLQHGFEVMQDDPAHPLVRLDLDRTVTWPWWSSLVDRVRRAVLQWDAPPHPTSRSMRSEIPVSPAEQGIPAHPPIHPREVPVSH